MLESALAHHRAGRLAEAEEIYRNILATDPQQADTLHLLGMIRHQQGHHKIAVEMILKAIAINADEAVYHSNLGTIFQAQGELDKAVACFERALALKPLWPELHSNLGNVFESQGKLEEAVACQERALVLKPNCAEAHSNLGNIRQIQGRFDDAVACYERALAINPHYADAHNNLGNALTELDKVGQAAAHYECALVAKPNWAYAHNNLANALARLDRTDDAQAHYERALALKPEYANAHNNLGNILKELGNFDGALDHYRQAIAIQPDYVQAHLNRAEIKFFQRDDADFAALEALAEHDDLPGDKMLYVQFALAKALNDMGEYGRAFSHLRQGNALKRQQVNYQEASALQLLRRTSSVFDRSLLQRMRGAGDPSSAPIFVLGMPRSGSTLIAQILASHPQIQGAGELTTLEKMEPSDPESLAALDARAVRSLGEAYVAHLPALEEGKIRVVDKLPGNFLRIGLIRMILPNARIIHTMRNPIDTCLSCYSKFFTYGLSFTYDLGELGRYYRAYSELMDHWRAVLPPGAMLDVSYEEVIDNLEGQARRLIDFCGLPWNDRCINFHQTKRPVKTASAVQVRQPLFRSSLERWRQYEADLGPLLDELSPIR